MDVGAVIALRDLLGRLRKAQEHEKAVLAIS